MRPDYVIVEPDGGSNSFGYRLVYESVAERYRKMGTSARPKYFALVDTLENAKALAQTLNRSLMVNKAEIW